VTCEQFKLIVRRVIAAVLFYSGLNAIYRFLTSGNYAVVLTYHRVLNQDDIKGYYHDPGIYVMKDTFEMQMRYLSSRFHLVSLGELVESLKNGGRLERNTCVITFDDGWRDTYMNGFPVLREYGIPAMVFLVSEYVGTNSWFWPERVAYLMTKYYGAGELKGHYPSKYPRVPELSPFFPVVDSGLTPGEKIVATIEAFKDLDQDTIEKMLLKLESALGIAGIEKNRKTLMLNWDEIREMCRSKITFGSHTKNHAILTRTSKKEIAEEVVGSGLQIAEHLASTCSAFCYPNGNYDDEIKEIVTRYYSCAFTSRHGFVRHGDDLFELKRIGIHNDVTSTRAMFACRISGFLDFLGL